MKNTIKLIAIILLYNTSCINKQQQDEYLSDVRVGGNNVAEFKYEVGAYEAQNLVTYALGDKIWHIVKANPNLNKIIFHIIENCEDRYGHSQRKQTNIVLDNQWLIDKEVAKYNDGETFGNRMSEMNIFGGEWRGCNM